MRSDELATIRTWIGPWSLIPSRTTAFTFWQRQMAWRSSSELTACSTRWSVALRRAGTWITSVGSSGATPAGGWGVPDGMSNPSACSVCVAGSSPVGESILIAHRIHSSVSPTPWPATAIELELRRVYTAPSRRPRAFEPAAGFAASMPIGLNVTRGRIPATRTWLAYWSGNGNTI